MRTLIRSAATAAAALALAIGVSACSSTSSEGDAQKRESATQQNNYTAQVAKQPAHRMTYSPTRDTINGFVDVWNKPGQLAYVYLKNANGDVTDYFVMKHPPVSMCVALTPTYKVLTYDGGTDGATSPVVVPAPSLDGAYYSGGDCNTQYGFDAVSGSYLQFTAGLGQNVLLFTQPLPPQQLQNATPYGKAAQDQAQQ